MRLFAPAPSLRPTIVPLLSLVILSSLTGCGGSASNSAGPVGGAKIDPEVEAQNRAAIETYEKEKGQKGR